MKNKQFNKIIFILYIFLLIRLTILRGNIYPSIKSLEDIKIHLSLCNFIPFATISHYIRYLIFNDLSYLLYNLYYFLINIIGNIIVFIPYSLILCEIISNSKLAIIYGFLFSLIIELIQLITCIGIFDIDDLILNTIGIIIGYLICKHIKFDSK